MEWVVLASLNWLTPFAVLLAADEPNPQAVPEGPSAFHFVTLFGTLALLYIVLIFLPDRDREKKRRSLLDSLKKNDKVTTAGGLIGLVANAKPGEDEVVLKIDEDKDVKVTVTRSSIVSVKPA